MGVGVDFHRSGSLKAAYTEAGEAHLHQGLETARGLGIETRLVSAREARQLAPHFEPGPARAIGHVPSDGWLEPAKVATGFAQRAAALGTRLMPFTPVTGLLHADGKVEGVQTARGALRAPVVVDAAGGWAARVAAAAGIQLPLVPVRHQLFITEPVAGVEPLQPIVRLLEASVYVRYAQGGLMFGGYEDHPGVIDAAPLPPGFQISDLPARPGRASRARRRGGRSLPRAARRARGCAPGRGADHDARRTADPGPGAGARGPLRRVRLLRRRSQSLAGRGAGAGRPDPRRHERSRPGAACRSSGSRDVHENRTSSRPRASASTRGSTRIERRGPVDTIDWSYHRNG